MKILNLKKFVFRNHWMRVTETHLNDNLSSIKILTSFQKFKFLQFFKIQILTVF